MLMNTLAKSASGLVGRALIASLSTAEVRVGAAIKALSTSICTAAGGALK